MLGEPDGGGQQGGDPHRIDPAADFQQALQQIRGYEGGQEGAAGEALCRFGE